MPRALLECGSFVSGLFYFLHTNPALSKHEFANSQLIQIMHLNT